MTSRRNVDESCGRTRRAGGLSPAVISMNHAAGVKPLPYEIIGMVSIKELKMLIDNTAEPVGRMV